jgi:Fur family peroxide stress response transcriptional regulator
MRDIDKIIKKFREVGLKITPQRLSILNLLKGNRAHPSAEDIYKEVLKIHPSISFTTVYKTLQTLRDIGEIRELTIDPERVHYDPDIREHVHTFCRSCKVIGDLEDGVDDAGILFSAYRDPQNFKVHNVQVHLVGLCGDCE